MRTPSNVRGPHLNHDTMRQAQQEKYLGVGRETVSNLGHQMPEDRLTENPARLDDYTNADIGKRIVREGQKHTRGVYGRHEPTPSGISTADNLDRWSGYARSNSYHGAKTSKREGKADGHLLKPTGGYEFGADSGPGRLEKFGK